MGNTLTGQTTVLIIEDNSANYKLLETILTTEGYKLLHAWNGAEGLQMLGLHFDVIDVVLLDLMMPKVSGIEFLERIRGENKYDNLPIIVQTADHSEAALQSVASLGVYFFLTKPIDIYVCQAVVRNAIEDARATEKILRQANRNELSFCLINYGEFTFKTEAEALVLAASLSNVCPAPRKQLLGLTELMINAVEHGNLGISQEEKHLLIEKNQLDVEIKKRLEQPPYCERKAKIKIEKNKKRIRFEISDEGEGFNWQKEIALSEKRFMQPSRRGIALAHKIGFDKIEYNARGNTVVAYADFKNGLSIIHNGKTAEDLIPKQEPREAFSVEEPLVTAAKMQMHYLPDKERLQSLKEKYRLDLSYFLHPSEELGGDHWGVSPIDDNRLAIFIIDSSSDGSEAAADTIWLDGAIWNTLRNTTAPAEMLKTLNESMISRSPEGSYVTMLFGVIDTANECLTYSTAGAPLPIVLSADMNSGVMGEGSGLPLGVVPNAPYREEVLNFSKDEILLLYSDGVIENPNMSGDIIGRASAVEYFCKIVRLHKDDVSAQHFLNCFRTDTKQPPVDDSTLVCCRRL